MSVAASIGVLLGFGGVVVSSLAWRRNKPLAVAFLMMSSVIVSVSFGLLRGRRWAWVGIQMLCTTHILAALFGALLLDARSMFIASSAVPAVGLFLYAHNAGVKRFCGVEPAQVEGWLLLACVGLVFISPLFGCVIPLVLYDESLLPSRDPAFRLMVSIDAWCVLAATVYGIRAGVALWDVEEGAVRRARRVLVIRFAYTLGFGGALFSRFPGEAWDWLAGGAGRYAMTIGLLHVALYSYFGHSKRVGDTYRDTPRP